MDRYDCVDRDDCVLRNALTRGQQSLSRGATYNSSAPRVEGYDTRRYADQTYERIGVFQSEIDGDRFKHIGTNGMPMSLSGKRTIVRNNAHNRDRIARSTA